MNNLKILIRHLFEASVLEFGPAKVKKFLEKYDNDDNQVLKSLTKSDFDSVTKIAKMNNMKQELESIKQLFVKWLLSGVGSAFHKHNLAEKECAEEWKKLDKKLKTRDIKYKFPTVLAEYTPGMNPVEALYFEASEVIEKIRRKEMLDERDKFIYHIAKTLSEDILKDIAKDREAVQAFRNKWKEYSPAPNAMKHLGYTSQQLYVMARFFTELNKNEFIA